MAWPLTSTGSPAKQALTSAWLPQLLGVAIGVLLPWVPALAQPQAGLLEPERAFAFSAQALDDRTIEARFVVAEGYYLYRDKLKFRIEPGTLAGAPALPPGKVKRDDFFGDVETYRGRLPVRLSLLRPAPGQDVTVVAESQGCADIGVCYPPSVQKIALRLPAAGAGPGAVVEAAPARKSWFR